MTQHNLFVTLVSVMKHIILEMIAERVPWWQGPEERWDRVRMVSLKSNDMTRRVNNHQRDNTEGSPLQSFCAWESWGTMPLPVALFLYGGPISSL
jgi:hypothetical protein